MSREQRAQVDALLRRPHPTEPRSVDEMRQGFAALMATMAVPDAITVEPTTLGDRPALDVNPDTGPGIGTLLYFHGGAWVFGSPETALGLIANLVVRTGMTGLSVDYRLAPEHPFPAAIDDALAAYRALLDAGTDPSTIAFAGDSAGGGLAIITLISARNADLPMPAAVVTFSAGLDPTRTGASMTSKVDDDPIFTREALERNSALHLGEQRRDDELVSPAVYADPTGFPPMLLQVGTNELLLDDSTRMAARAAAAGVDVILDITADVPHVFQSFVGVLDEADHALERAALFLRQHVSSAAHPY